MPYNYNLCRLYEDSLLMSSYQDNYEAINFGLDYIKSADTFLISYFNISDNNKLARLIASDSVFPEFKPSRKITIKTTETIDLNSEDYSWLKILLNDLNYTKFEKVTYNDSFFDGKNGNITVDYDCNAYIATNYYNQKIIIFIECIEEDLEVNPYQTKHEYLINISIVDTENSDTTETEITEEDSSEDIETENETSENIEESTETEEGASSEESSDETTLGESTPADESESETTETVEEIKSQDEMDKILGDIYKWQQFELVIDTQKTLQIIQNSTRWRSRRICTHLLL